MNKNKQAQEGQLRGAQILAFMIPLTVAMCSIAWAIAVYFMNRERLRTQVELARIAAGERQEEASAIELS